ncbi:hypothetical protein B0H13DRAFT_1918132 [Mycena leptocephala]|nr:hypothetical protein B0H13DRAFT_1918132 [Mycena leptocephala]
MTKMFVSALLKIKMLGGHHLFISGSDLSSSDEGSCVGSPMPDATPKVEVKPKKVKAVATEPIPSLVQVNFFDEKDAQAAPRQVPILSGDIPITAFAADDGSTHYKTALSKLLPVAFQNDSPIKERGGRIYRPNIRGDVGHHHIGRIDAIVSGDARPLQIEDLDQYTLRISNGGSLHCDVFWEQAGVVVGPLSIDLAPQDGDSAPWGSEGRPPAEQRLQFTGAGSDVPLAIATDRATHNPTGQFATPEMRKAFTKFLYDFAKPTLPNLLEFGVRWPRAKQAGLLLDRLLTQEKLFDVFTSWNRPTGGYKVPAGHAQYAGVSFTREHLIEATGLGSSSSAGTSAVFSSKELNRAPKAKAWYESGGVTHDDLFRRMKTADFKKYIESGGKSIHAQRRSRSASPGEGSSRKHKKNSRVESDDDSGEERRRKKRSRRKAASGNDSEALDD